MYLSSLFLFTPFHSCLLFTFHSFSRMPPFHAYASFSRMPPFLFFCAQMRDAIHRSALSLAEAFDVLDRNGSGELDANGCFDAFRDANIFKTTLNHGVGSKEDVEEMLRAISGATTCQYNDFATCMRLPGTAWVRETCLYDPMLGVLCNFQYRPHYEKTCSYNCDG